MRDIDGCRLRRRGLRGHHDLCRALVIAERNDLRVLYPAERLQLIRGIEEGRQRRLVLGALRRSSCFLVLDLCDGGDFRLRWLFAGLICWLIPGVFCRVLGWLVGRLVRRGLRRVGRRMVGRVLGRAFGGCLTGALAGVFLGFVLSALGCHQWGERGGIGVDGVGIDNREERPVDAGAEALGQQVGGLALGGIGIRGGIGRQRQIHVKHGGSHGAEGEDDEGHRQAGHLLYQPYPAIAHGRAAARLALAGRIAGHAGDAAGKCLVPQKSEHRGDEREGDQDGDGHGGRRGKPHGGEEFDARNEQGKKRGKDGGAGEDHGRARRSCRHTGGLWGGHAGPLGAVAGQDKQRIVDAHRQANHDGQHRRHVVELDPVRGNHHAACAQANPDDGRNQRHSGGDQGTEGKDEYEEGHAQADDLGGGIDPNLIAKAGSAGLDGKSLLPADVHRFRHDVLISLVHAIGRFGIEVEGGIGNGLVFVDHGEVIGIGTRG